MLDVSIRAEMLELKKVIPGDTIVFRCSLISPIRRGLCHMHGVGFVDGKIVETGGKELSDKLEKEGYEALIDAISEPKMNTMKN